MVFLIKKIVNIYLILVVISLIIFLSIYYLYLISLVYFFYFICFFSLIFFSIYFFKIKIKKKQKIKDIENDIPFFIDNFSNDVYKNIPLKIALKNRIDNTEIGKRIKKAIYLIENKNYSLEKSLNHVSLDNYNLNIVFRHIIDTYNIGDKDKYFVFKTLSDSFYKKQLNDLEGFSSKLNFISLIFIIISAVLPSLFLIFVIISSNFFEISFSVLSIIFIANCLFPIIDMFLLFTIKLNNP